MADFDEINDGRTFTSLAIRHPVCCTTIVTTAFLTSAAISQECLTTPMVGCRLHMGIAIANYDGNGFLDIAKTNFSGDRPSLYRNDDGKFFEKPLRIRRARPQSAAWLGHCLS